MSEVEKLRALLHETREWLKTYRDPNDGFALYAATPLLARIDAALAEPVVKGLDVVELEDAALDAEDGRRRAEVSLAEALSSARSWEIHTHAANLRAERAEKERDEARAEVERLKVFASRLYAAAIPGVTFATQYEDLMIENVRDGTADRERNAYRRGAEAMREAAASCVLDSARFWSAQYVADDIRALPIPKDKP